MEARLMLSANGAETPPLEEPVLWLPGSISGAVYASSQPSEQRQASDPGIPGVLLDLLDDQNRVVAKTTTDEAGQYEFSPLAPGRYAVREHQPAGTLDGQAWIGDGGGQLAAIDVIDDILVGPGANLAGYDFAEIADSSPAIAALSHFFAGPSLPFMALGEAPAIERSLASASAEEPTPIARSVSSSAEPVVAPTATPVFGGSSRELKRDPSSSEVKRSVADPADDWLAQHERSNENEHSENEPVRVARLPAKERAARDRAFEQDGEAEPDNQPAPRASTASAVDDGK